MAGFPRRVGAGGGRPTPGRRGPQPAEVWLSTPVPGRLGAPPMPAGTCVSPWGEGRGKKPRFSRYPQGGEYSLSRVGGGKLKGSGRGGGAVPPGEAWRELSERIPGPPSLVSIQGLRERPQTSQDEPGRRPPREDLVPWLPSFLFFSWLFGAPSF